MGNKSSRWMAGDFFVRNHILIATIATDSEMVSCWENVHWLPVAYLSWTFPCVFNRPVWTIFCYISLFFRSREIANNVKATPIQQLQPGILSGIRAKELICRFVNPSTWYCTRLLSSWQLRMCVAFMCVANRIRVECAAKCRKYLSHPSFAESMCCTLCVSTSKWNYAKTHRWTLGFATPSGNRDQREDIINAPESKQMKQNEALVAATPLQENVAAQMWWPCACRERVNSIAYFRRCRITHRTRTKIEMITYLFKRKSKKHQRMN